MYPAKIVIGKMQSASSFQIIEFLGKGVRQARKTPYRHSESEIASLDVTGRDVARVGPSVAYLHYRFDHRRRRVPTSGIMLPVISVYLYHLREVCLSGEDFFDSLPVKVESICGDLKAVLWCKPVSQASQELVCGFTIALADGVCRNQFCVRVNCDEYPSISEFCGILCFYVALFLAAISPDFVALNPRASQILHAGFHQLYAAFACKYQQSKNRIPMQTCNTFGAPDAGTFNQQLNRQKCTVFGNCHRAEQPRMFFRVGLPTLRAAKSLQPIAVLPKFPAPEIALEAFHG
jgi:hypothetical protein